MDDKILRDAQYRKGLSIAFFNATNSAINLIAGQDFGNQKETLAKVVEVRDFFLEEHKKYYSEVIAQIGKPYDCGQTIKKLKETKTLEELETAWLNLSEDERRDGDIIREVNLLKKSYASS